MHDPDDASGYESLIRMIRLFERDQISPSDMWLRVFETVRPESARVFLDSLPDDLKVLIRKEYYGLARYRFEPPEETADLKVAKVIARWCEEQGNPNHEQPLRTLPPSRILVVYNDKAAAKEVATQLRKMEHEVEVAYDGPSALELEPTFRPDIVIIDFGLQGMDACTVARSLRAQAKRDVIVAADCMFVADGGSQEDYDLAREAGCFDDHVGRAHGIPILPRLRIKLANESVESWFVFGFRGRLEDDFPLQMLDVAAGQFEPAELAPLIPDEFLREIRRLAESPTDLEDYMARFKWTIGDERLVTIRKGASRWFHFFNP
jgi:CheY-like chemotaxis protein